MKDSMSTLNGVIKEARRNYFSELISKNNPRFLFETVDNSVNPAPSCIPVESALLRVTNDL